MDPFLKMFDFWGWIFEILLRIVKKKSLDANNYEFIAWGMFLFSKNVAFRKRVQFLVKSRNLVISPGVLQDALVNAQATMQCSRLVGRGKEFSNAVKEKTILGTFFFRVMHFSGEHYMLLFSLVLHSSPRRLFFELPRINFYWPTFFFLT